MQYVRKIILIALAASLISGLSACGEQAEVSTAEPDPTYFYEEVREDILIDADVIRPGGDTVPRIYVAERITFSEEKVVAFLSALGDGVETVTYDATVDGVRTYYADTKAGCEIAFSTSPDVETLNDCFAFYDLAYDYYYDAVLRSHSRSKESNTVEPDNSYLYIEPREFSFGSVEQAEEQVRKVLATLGLHDLILEEILYMDHNTMAEEELRGAEIYNSIYGGYGETYKFKDSWTEVDDCYFFQFCTGIDGIATVKSLQSSPLLFIQPGYIQVYYNASGIVKLIAGYLWEATVVIEDSAAIVSATEAMDVIREKLNSVYYGHDVQVMEIALRYQVIQNYNAWKLSPVWEVLMCEKGVTGQWSGDTHDAYSYILIDAVTGEEM